MVMISLGTSIHGHIELLKSNKMLTNDIFNNVCFFLSKTYSQIPALSAEEGLEKEEGLEFLKYHLDLTSNNNDFVYFLVWHLVNL